VTHLSTEDIKKLEARLKGQRLDLLLTIREHLHPGGDADELGLANHYAEVREQAEADLMANTDLGQLQVKMAELTEIDGALARIAARSYGLCTRCGTPVAARRLRAIPAAEMCLACQMMFEQQRQSHHPGAR
jgi:DnaK suppressor protein